MEEDLLEKVKERLNIKDFKQDDTILGYIEEFQSKIKSICKRDDFPKELEYMCVEYAKKCHMYYSNLDESKNQKLEIVSASDSGQSVNFKTIDIVNSDDIDIDKVIAKNMAEISNYAYMGW